ncbi:methyltransferase domain-containing protein [Geobacter pelophilus]|uniref:Methyltransferase domain-containing protein n=1 Tax=Geoanaerobacter pelophilus TaxID=60036 RepID=A0AAW4LBH0_9BACT|nr:class I SAM-dependent methyltransferase [Geoanaerobacter pelophilus]MBT0664541.1 methyltransferase domain-containing protein [Geoanaerobacter pelophilus]
MTSEQKQFIISYLNGSNSIVIYGAGYYGLLLSNLIGELDDIDVTVVDDIKKGKCGSYTINNDNSFNTITGTVVITIKDLDIATSIAQRLYAQGVTDIRLLSNRLKEFLDVFSQGGKNLQVSNYHRDDLLNRLKSFNWRKLNKDYIAYSFRYLWSWMKKSFMPSNIENAVCPVCKGSARLLCVNVWNYFIMECVACTHVFVANVPSGNAIVDFYDGYEYFTQNCAHQGITSLTDDTQWQGWLNSRMQFLDFFHILDSFYEKPAVVLELGCCEGKLLERLKKLGHHVYGCDVNAGLAALAGRTLGIDIRAGTLEEAGFQHDTFDLIIAIHTVEHLTDPHGDLVRCWSLLRKGGRILIEVPIGETDYNNPHHLHFFSERSLRELFTKLFGNISMVPSCFADANGNFCATALTVAVKL